MINSMICGLPDPDEPLTYDEVVKFLRFKGLGPNMQAPTNPQESMVFSMLRMKINNTFNDGESAILEYLEGLLSSDSVGGRGDRVPEDVQQVIKKKLEEKKNEKKNSQGISGNTIFQAPHAFKDTPLKCNTCGKTEGELFRCTRCEEAVYCGRECQKCDWRDHKHSCVSKKPIF